MTANSRLAKNKIHELANQVYVLATGLQNAAPSGSPGKSVQYLLEVAVLLQTTSHEIEKLLSDEDSHNKVLELIQKTIEQEIALREKYEVGDKFRFVRERLKQIQTQLESELHIVQKEEKSPHKKLEPGEVPVYVYLYNAKGLQLSTWINLLTPKVFYEYSINRPIYTELSYIHALLKTKTNKQQHAYLTVAMKPEDILPSTQKDMNDNPIVKVRENSLRFDRFISFTHMGQSYFLTQENELQKI